jgi:hypothetical protein
MLSENENHEIIGLVSEVLQVPPETVIQWLGELNMVPADLTDAKAVADVLKLAFDVQEPAALLTLPEFPVAYKAINEAMAALKPGLEITDPALPSEEAPVVSIPSLEGLQVVTDENNRPVVTYTQEAPKAVAEAGLVQIPANDLPEEWIAEPVPETAEVSQAVSPAAGATADNRPQNNDTLTSNDDQPPSMAQTDIHAVPLTNAHFESVAARVAAAVENVRGPVNTPVNTADVMNQIVSSVRAQAGENFTELRIILRPENLGDVTLRVMTQNGIVTAQFVAENQRVKEALESNFNLLRNALEEQGIELSELTVSVRQDENERMNQFAQARQNSRNRMQRITNAAADAQNPIFGETAAPVYSGSMDFTA